MATVIDAVLGLCYQYPGLCTALVWVVVLCLCVYACVTGWHWSMRYAERQREHKRYLKAYNREWDKLLRDQKRYEESRHQR